MEGWRKILNTKYDKDLEKISNLFTTNHRLSSIGLALKRVFDFKGDFVLVGGLARRFHSTPRNTGDIDILFRNEEDLNLFLQQNLGNYKKLRNHAIIVDGVEVDLITPEFLKISQDIVNYVFTTKENAGDNINVASKEGMILLKLYRLSSTDDNDIRALIESGGKNLKLTDILFLAGGKKDIIENILTQSEMYLTE